MHLSNKKILVTRTKILKLKIIPVFASILAIVIDIKVAKTKASFLVI